MSRFRFEACAALALFGCAELGSGASPIEELADGSTPKHEDAAPTSSANDAAGPDSAPPRADAAPDAADAATPPGDTLGCAAHPDALLCEDFESGSLDTTLWTKKLQGAAELGIGAEQRREGQKALRIVLPAAEATGAMIRTKAPFPLSPNRYFGRAWFLVESAVPDVHSYLIASRGLLDGALAKYGLDSNAGKLNSRYTHPTITEHGGLKKLSYPMPESQWLCVEWEHDGENNQLRYWFDDELATALTVSSSEDPPWVAPPAFTELDIGWHNFQSPTNADPTRVFIDAIVLDTERIGCGTSADS